MNRQDSEVKIGNLIDERFGSLLTEVAKETKNRTEIFDNINGNLE
mgnify:CR=1 FL=1